MSMLLIGAAAAGAWWLRTRKFAGLLLTAGLILSLLACGGLGIATRVAPEHFCDPALGLHLYAQADAGANGYALPLPAGERHFRQAVYDLIQGRVAFVEIETAPGVWQRYRLGGHRSASCIARRRVDDALAELPIPMNQCVQAAPITTLASRYIIELAPAIGDGAELLVLRERETAVVLAEYRPPHLLPPALTNFACPHSARVQAAASMGSLTGLVLADRWGGRLELADLEDFEAADATKSTPGIPAMLPSIADVRRRLAGEGRLDRRECSLPGWMGPTEVHALELKRGPLDMQARLDAASTTAGVVLLDVHAPDKSVVILASAEEPTIWHIHESGRTNIIAVLLRGQHGQAVLGLTPFSRILMSTEFHNPYTNCSAGELRAIEQRVVQQYHVKSRQRDQPRLGKPPVRYSLGEPMPEGAQLFHDSFALSDFEISD